MKCSRMDLHVCWVESMSRKIWVQTFILFAEKQSFKYKQNQAINQNFETRFPREVRYDLP